MADALEVIAQHGPFALTTMGAVPSGDPTFEQWAAAVTWVQQVERCSLFWLGDLLAYGDIYGERASQVLDPTVYAEGTCANAKYVALAIPPERRKPTVPFSHHQEIAALASAEDQDVWLAKCEEEQPTRDELRMQLKAVKALAGQAIDYWLVVSCEDADDQSTLADKLRLEGRQVKMQAKAVDPVHA